MQLTQFSDYALRVLLFLAAHHDRQVSVQEVSRAYGISHHHLVKVVQRLVAEGLVITARGRRGGLRLAVDPAAVNIGKVVRMTEPHFNIVECFDRDTNKCPIDRVCGLKQVLQRAQGGFLAVLDEHTLADFMPRAPALIRLWKTSDARTKGQGGP